MDSDSDSDFEPTFSHLKESKDAESQSQFSYSALHEKSRKKYENSYQRFLEWRNEKKFESFSENVLLTYFAEIASNKKPSTLYNVYSILRTTLNIHNGIDIARYIKLRTFLKRKSHGYSPRKSSVFEPEDIKRFLREAPDDRYLLMKVILITGVMGACRCHEINKMKAENFKFLDNSILVCPTTSKNERTKVFTIPGRYYDIFKKFLSLRPPHCSWFFMSYNNGKCNLQRVGLNRIGTMPREIATFLKLPNPKGYTGHCFRRTAATIFLNDTGDIISMKKHRGRRSPAVASVQLIEEEMEDSVDSNTVADENFVVEIEDPRELIKQEPDDVKEEMMTIEQEAVVDQDVIEQESKNWTQKLIRAIQLRPPLYDKALRDYSDSKMVTELWNQVFHLLVDNWDDLSVMEKNIKAIDIRQRWNDIRTSFKAELNKQRESKVNKQRELERLEQNEDKYPYFDELLFLLPKNIDEPARKETLEIASKKKTVEEIENIDEDKTFLLSLVPSFRKFSDEQKLDAKLGFLTVLKRVAQATKNNVHTKNYILRDHYSGRSPDGNASTASETSRSDYLA